MLNLVFYKRSPFFLKNHMIKPGDIIKIIKMDDISGKDSRAKEFNGKTGIVTHVDGAGQIHGTWGGLAIIPEIDKFEIVKP